MTELYHCTCDPHGDNARCNRPCCRTPEERAAEANAIVLQARQVMLQKHRTSQTPTEVLIKE